MTTKALALVGTVLAAGTALVAQTARRPMTIDDFAYARDNALPFGTSTSIPEPSSWFLMLSGSASLAIVAARKRARY